MRIRVARLLDCLVITLLAIIGSTARLVAGQYYQDCVLSNPPWSECSKNCGEGERFKDRKIEKLPWGQGSYPCSRFSTGVITYINGGTYYRERRACNNGKCQDCVLSNPGWSGCSKNCGGGEHIRDRRVQTWHQQGGNPCSSYSNGVLTNINGGDYFRERKPCNTRRCQDCVVNHWGSWGACSVSCYPGGRQTRRRSVRTNPEAGGKECPKLTEEQTCNTRTCPEDCEREIHRQKGNCVGDCGEGLMNVTLVIEVTKKAVGDGKPYNETQQVIEETCDTGVSCPASALVLGASIGSAVLLFAGCSICLVVLFMRKKRTKNPPTTLEAVPNNIEEQASTSFILVQPLVFKELNLPAHSTLKKDNSLQENVKELAGNKNVLDTEFNRLVDFVEKNVVKASTVAKTKENKPHNRYVDIVPFDDNLITLASKMFQTEDETNYINASRIVFTGCSQAFIAAQAPKPISFNHFWHMVIEEKVNVIVMITRLVEKKKLKAHQYWPDSEGKEVAPVLDIGGGCKVEHVSTSYQGTYFLRKFTVWLADGGSREVTQLHTENWPDLEAPDDPKVLVDMVFRVHEMQQPNPGCLLVHCSAGVGRTGTFLALYKLWLDYNDDRVPSLSLLPTVVALRRQRCFMVQRTPQYRYVVKCLSFMVSVEEGNYYETV